MKKFKFYKQLDAMDCGPTCLRMIAKHYGVDVSLNKLKKLSETTREGSNLQAIAYAAEKLGFRTLGVKINYKLLANEVPLPCIVHWNQEHFVVVYKIKKGKVWLADPAHKLYTIKEDEFIKSWIGQQADNKTNEGIVLMFETTPKLEQIDEIEKVEIKGIKFLLQYFLKYKKFIYQLLIGLFAGSLLQLIIPFLTQSIVDVGIQNQDINFIYLVLFAQLFLFAGRISIEIIRGWILLHLSTRINISLISDFFVKLMNLPISFFDSKMIGDILQRIDDHQRVEKLLTTSSLETVFSLFNLLVFSFVLVWYSTQIFIVFIAGSLLYLLWVVIFLKKRKNLDYKRFNQLSEERSKVIELISGMQEIKLHNAEKKKRWSWELLQVKLYKLDMKYLTLEQTQRVGSNVINELKNIFITVLAAKLVIYGSITLGMMLAITYIIGQLNSPIQQLIAFVYSVQDAKIALERLSEIHNLEDEEPIAPNNITNISDNENIFLEPIQLNNISFRYNGNSDYVIKDLSLKIPSKKITAIVGSSGSGKTTLMKILLKFYEPQKGEITIGDAHLNEISQYYWRELCGVVMQEGFIFNDTIANNIAVGKDRINYEKLIQAAKIANIIDYIKELPLGFNSKIGIDGIGMSTGQKQRILIARAVYKNPDIIFFDEATSALDSKNEKLIMENLNNFFRNKTSIIIAHRLSTVKNADQIVVLEKGNIIEKGTHRELLELKGSYFNLVKNQLELEKLNNA